ncbi:Nitrate reductase (NADH) [Hordeum vulgare]|nr:Nitrate reductase (NADH) [Hordeum vulgare]
MPEELGQLAVKLEDDTVPPRGGVISPKDYLPPGQEDHLMRAIMDHSIREVEEVGARNRRELQIEQIFLEQGVPTSQASASKEADLRVMKAEQAKVWIDLDTNSDED